MKNGKIDYKNRGFTLVEILIVMAIVAMLSTLAVNGYMTYRKNTLLDLSADNLISQIMEMKSKTVYGIGGSDDSSKCYGVYFGKGGDGFIVKGFEQDFNNKKVWDKVRQKWHYQGCVEFQPDAANLVLEEDSQVKILEIKNEKDVQFNSLVLRFFPPNGVLEMSMDNGQYFNSKFESGNLVKIKLQYGSDENLQYQREINFDLANKTAVVNRLD